MSRNDANQFDWELLLAVAARWPRLLPGADLVRGLVGGLVGGADAALDAGRWISNNADQALVDWSERFAEALLELESVTGWASARIKRPVSLLGNLGNLDGIETGVRQLIRSKPLETTVISYKGLSLTVPTEEETLRIKSFLILKRNATRDYVDFIAIADHLGPHRVAMALRRFDSLYPQKSGQSALQQLLAQLSNARPYDLDKVDLANFRDLDSRWNDIGKVRTASADLALNIFDLVSEMDSNGQP
ncbi:MAG: hypothetical protein LBS60_13665 [Deltaproteobacteria bacterium]|jgi:hypothetical protein|nr:hypothetical protein [Deltaproteobacteria bacterium]